MSFEKKLSLLDLSMEEFDFLEKAGYPKFRKKQVYLASRQYKSYENMTNIPKDLREFLKKDYVDIPTKIIETFVGKDGTEKYLFLLTDGNIVEGVFMPHSYGNSIIGSQQRRKRGISLCKRGCASHRITFVLSGIPRGRGRAGLTP